MWSEIKEFGPGVTLSGAQTLTIVDYKSGQLLILNGTSTFEGHIDCDKSLIHVHTYTSYYYFI